MFEAQLKDVPFFSGLSKRELATVAQQTDEIDVESGHELTRQGESGQEFFVIIDGTAEVLRDDAAIAELGPGEFFGEMALIAPGKRLATVRAVTPVETLRIPAEAFQAFVAGGPGSVCSSSSAPQVAAPTWVSPFRGSPRRIARPSSPSSRTPRSRFSAAARLRLPARRRPATVQGSREVALNATRRARARLSVVRRPARAVPFGATMPTVAT